MRWTAGMRLYIIAVMKNQQFGNQKRQREAAEIWTKRRPEIERLYVNGTWSQAQLAAHYDVSQQGMARALVRMEIPTKSRGRPGPQNGRFKDGTQSTIYRKMVEKNACARCSAIDNLLVHHRDNVHTNNAPENLEVLCSPCHTSHHKSEWWSRKRAGRF